MQPLKLDQFLEYKFLSNIRYSPDGKRAAFVVSRCDAEENGYCANLYLYDERGIRRLSGMDKESAFFWEDDMHVLFAANRSADEKKRAEAGEADRPPYSAWWIFPRRLRRSESRFRPD